MILISVSAQNEAICFQAYSLSRNGDTEEVPVKPLRVGCVRDKGEKWGDKKGNNKAAVLPEKAAWRNTNRKRNNGKMV